jgi:hypothetical protein
MRVTHRSDDTPERPTGSHHVPAAVLLECRGGTSSSVRNVHIAIEPVKPMSDNLTQEKQRADAMRAPSASTASLAHTTSGSTAACPTHVP